MTKVIKGKGKAGASSSDFIIQGTEHCTPRGLVHLTPRIKELGFTKVTSHSHNLDIGDGSNALTLHSDQSTEIVRSVEVTASVIYVDTHPVGAQGDNYLPPSIVNSPLSRAGESNYVNDRGALIVSNDRRIMGHYNSTLNMLTLTDLTHNSYGLSKLSKVLTQLKHYKEHFGIGSIEKKIKKDKVVLLYPKIPNKLVIGLDPELAVIDKYNVFQQSPFDGGGSDAEIGSDCGNVEIRPKPGTPKQVVKTVKGLYEKMDKRLEKNLRLFSGGGDPISRTLGGHIHFNTPKHVQLTALLDDFIGKPMKRMNGATRCGNSYGSLGSVKDQPHGFEYRTPPSFVGKPDLFAGVIAVAYCIVSTWRTISNRGITFEYGCGDATGAYRSSYEKLTYYKTYKKEIEGFLSYVYDEEKTIEELDVLAAWEVRDAVCLEDITI